MDFPLSQIAALVPSQIDFLSVLKFIALLVVAGLIFSTLCRLVFGKHSALNHALSSAIAIVFVYVAAIVIYTFFPQGFARFLTPLPFVQFSDGFLYLLDFSTASFTTICTEILSLYLLSFLVNAIDSIIPCGKTRSRWLFLRMLSIVLALTLHDILTWASNTYLPGLLVTYAPIILLGVLLVSLLIGFLNLILGFVIAAWNPIFGILYSFFFSTLIGKQLSKAALSTGFIIALLCLLISLGYGVIAISAAALLSYLPLLLVLLLLWYFIRHFL